MNVWTFIEGAGMLAAAVSLLLAFSLPAGALDRLASGPLWLAAALLGFAQWTFLRPAGALGWAGLVLGVLLGAVLLALARAPGDRSIRTKASPSRQRVDTSVSTE